MSITAVDWWLIFLVAGLIIVAILFWRENGQLGEDIETLDGIVERLEQIVDNHLEVPHVTNQSGDWHLTQRGETVPEDEDAGLARVRLAVMTQAAQRERVAEGLPAHPDALDWYAGHGRQDAEPYKPKLDDLYDPSPESAL